MPHSLQPAWEATARIPASRVFHAGAAGRHIHLQAGNLVYEHLPHARYAFEGEPLVNGFYHSSAGDDNILVLDGNTGAEQGGESLARQEYEKTGQTLENEPQPSQETSGDAEITNPETGAETAAPETATGETSGEAHTEPTPEPTEEDSVPELDNPDISEAQYAGNVVIVGDRAMEIPTATNSVIESYAKTVNALADALGSDVRTISLVTPNGGEFYSPESMHQGLNSQKDMIDYCYGKMGKDILTVDAYSKLRAHTDEYIFFRTDHHWTQLGAYYAYTAVLRGGRL